MGDMKVNTVNRNCPSFYKEKVKDNHKNSKQNNLFKKLLRNIKGQK